MNVLIVAHPDDEILWFNPEDFDRIIIVFSERNDKPGQGKGRWMAMKEHPLADRITCLAMTESNFWRDQSQGKLHADNYKALCAELAKIHADSVTTHNAMGEYQHADHILVHNACMATFHCRVNGKNPDIYRRAKAAYERNGAWTWY